MRLCAAWCRYKGTDFRTIFFWAWLVQGLSILPDLMLVSRANVALGLPDHVFMIGARIAPAVPYSDLPPSCLVMSRPVLPLALVAALLDLFEVVASLVAFYCLVSLRALHHLSQCLVSSARVYAFTYVHTGDQIFHQMLGQLKHLPFLVLAARICPDHVEATLFATIMSISNIGSDVAHFWGAALLNALGPSSHLCRDLCPYLSASDRSSVHPAGCRLADYAHRSCCLMLGWLSCFKSPSLPVTG